MTRDLFSCVLFSPFQLICVTCKNGPTSHSYQGSQMKSFTSSFFLTHLSDSIHLTSHVSSGLISFSPWSCLVSHLDCVSDLHQVPNFRGQRDLSDCPFILLQLKPCPHAHCCGCRPAMEQSTPGSGMWLCRPPSSHGHPHLSVHVAPHSTVQTAQFALPPDSLSGLRVSAEIA